MDHKLLIVMKRLTIGLICLYFFLLSCSKQKSNQTHENINLYSILNDSLDFFHDVHEKSIQGEIIGEKVKIKYYSISKESFFNAIQRNTNNIRLFNKHTKLNEDIKNANRKGFDLDIAGKFGHICLLDLDENAFHRARNFFLENKIGDYYIVKRIQFEDAETVFLNSKTGEEYLFLDGISVSTSTKDSLVFYSNVFKVMPEDSNPICLMKIQGMDIDTLCCKNTDWFTNFSFFDERDSSIYYIHNCYEGYDLKSTYAKMDFSIY